MSAEKTPDDYEVGYGKPPKETRFQKGRSGNPRGRPKKAPDVHRQLIKETQSLVVINENGKRIRISKLEVALKQLLKLAMTGNLQALRILFEHYRQAVESTALLEAQQTSGAKKSDNPKDYTEEELERLLWEALKEKEPKS